MGENDTLVGEPNSQKEIFLMYQLYVLIYLSYKLLVYIHKHSTTIN